MRERFIEIRFTWLLIGGIGAVLLAAVGFASAAKASGVATPTADAAGAEMSEKPSAGDLAAGDFVPGEVVVRFKGAGDSTVEVPSELGVGATVRALKKNPAVRYAAPNHIATVSASGFVPSDSGTLARPTRRPPTSPQPSNGVPPPSGTAGGWMERQWNFLPYEQRGASQPISAGGIDAILAWRNLRRVRRPGGRGVTVAVVDTGVAYRDFGRRFRRNPDFSASQFVPGWDFVLDNRHPLDRNGHGTHVAGTIAQNTNNGIGLTGIAYGAKIMPIRVLDARGNGASDRIASGIRWAVDNGADIINTSFNFGCGDKVPNVVAAIRYAHRKGVITVASVGNAQAESCVSAPATAPHAIGVGGTTEGGCLGEYSLAGPGLDLTAPGGGNPLPGIGCEGTGGRPIYQTTMLAGDRRRFGFPERFFGTSMAAAHVSGTAALIIASGVLGRNPTPKAVARRLAATARPPRAPIRTAGYGAGIIDAGAATTRRIAADSRRR